MKIQNVSFKVYYDLVFKARNSRLNCVIYVLDFYDWVKAGVAYNTRGCEVRYRKISYFAELYTLLKKAEDNADPSVIRDNYGVFAEALTFYYEDIFELYQDHLRSTQQEAINSKVVKIPDFGDVLILPCFDCTPMMREVFDTEDIAFEEYECQNPNALCSVIGSAYLPDSSPIYRSMGILYDYGPAHVKRGVLLEVDVWEDQR